MIRILIFLLFFATNVCASPPSRLHTYTTGTTIEASKVTANEDEIFNYLNAGTDRIVDGTVVNADVNTNAAISDTKLNLATIAQAIEFNGTSDFDGTVTFDGTTISDLGTVTTADINGGTMDGVQVGGTTSTGELLLNDSSDGADGLGSQGTSGQVLTSAGAGANPTWTTPYTKAFVTFDGDANDQATIKDSFNVSGVVRDAEGVYTVSWDTDFADTDYGVLCTAIKNQCNYGSVATDTVVIYTEISDGTDQDATHVSVIAFSS